MVKIFDNILTHEQIQILLDFYFEHDHLVDDRLDVRSKTLDWNNQDWPQHIVKAVLDQVLGSDYAVEVVLFYGSQISFRLHTDSGTGDDRPLLKNVLIPLHTQGPASTVLFDNYWYGPHARFGRTPVSPFAYSLPDRNGKLQSFADIRILLQQCQHTPESIKDFEITSTFIQALEHIIKARSDRCKPPDDYVTDYSNIVNYRPNERFDPGIHAQYLNHIPIENLHGLTLDRVIPWLPGQVITFDRNQLHAAGAGHDFKIGISIFTYRA